MSMKTSEAWGITIVLILGLVLALYQMGVNVPALLGTAFDGTAHFLNQPLLGLT